MFSRETAKKVTYILSSDVEKDFQLMLDDLINQELSKIKANTPDLDLRAIAIRKEMLEKLKDYRKYLEQASKNG